MRIPFCANIKIEENVSFFTGRNLKKRFDESREIERMEEL